MTALLRRSAGYSTVCQVRPIASDDTIGDAELGDLDQLSEADLTIIKTGEIQRGAVLLDERATLPRHDRVAGNRRALPLVREERQDALFAALNAELATFRARGQELSMPAAVR